MVPRQLPERVFELLASYQPQTNASLEGLVNLQDRLERIELGRLSFEIQGWCSRELLHAAKAAGGVGTHFRDVFLSMPLEDQYRLRERQTRDEGQVLPMVKKESSDG